ncbi:MAG: hypothetical protein LC667_20250 [Thioalkalivibrio sp.]|nr:hypothetical protein [Thioalkalivibrio sp.]
MLVQQLRDIVDDCTALVGVKGVRTRLLRERRPRRHGGTQHQDGDNGKNMQSPGSIDHW